MRKVHIFKGHSVGWSTALLPTLEQLERQHQREMLERVVVGLRPRQFGGLRRSPTARAVGVALEVWNA